MMVGGLEEDRTGIDRCVHAKVSKAELLCAICWISFTLFVWKNLVRDNGSEIFPYSHSDNLTRLR